MILFILTIVVLILNIPFGYWRTNVIKFSLQWWLAIHLPVPFVIAARIFFGFGFEPLNILILVTAFFTGQLIGRIIFMYRQKNELLPLSSCLFMDLIRANNS